MRHTWYWCTHVRSSTYVTCVCNVHMVTISGKTGWNAGRFSERDARVWTEGACISLSPQSSTSGGSKCTQLSTNAQKHQIPTNPALSLFSLFEITSVALLEVYVQPQLESVVEGLTLLLIHQATTVLDLKIKRIFKNSITEETNCWTNGTIVVCRIVSIWDGLSQK